MIGSPCNVERMSSEIELGVLGMGYKVSVTRSQQAWQLAGTTFLVVGTTAYKPSLSYCCKVDSIPPLPRGD